MEPQRNRREAADCRSTSGRHLARTVRVGLTTTNRGDELCMASQERRRHPPLMEFQALQPRSFARGSIARVPKCISGGAFQTCGNSVGSAYRRRLGDLWNSTFTVRVTAFVISSKLASTRWSYSSSALEGWKEWWASRAVDGSHCFLGTVSFHP